MPRNPQPPMLAPVRARIVDAMLGAAVVLAAPATLLSVLASASAGLPMVTWASGLAYVWLVAVRFAPRIGSRTKAVSLVVVMHLVGAILLYGLGPVGPGLMWLMAASVTAAALLQAEAARLAFMAHLGSIAAATLVFMLFPTDSYMFPHSGLGWFASAAGSLLLGGTLAVAVSTLVSDLERMIVGLSAERLHLKQETARRARLEAELERRVADRTAELAAAIAELERKNVAVERADKVKSEFLSTMSHELRTPLNSVIGFSDLLLEMDDEALPTRQRHFVQAIGKAGRHQLGLITDILDLSKIEAGHLRLTPGVLGVEAMLTGASDAVAPQAGRKGVTVTTTTDAELCVTADAARLYQVLLNVLSNAVKFTPEGSAVEVSAVADGPMVRFEVADVGPGVPPEMWSRLFQPFEQAESAQNRRNEGTGLGLAISRRLIKAQGGEIEARERAGGGLVVRFTLPRADAGSAEPIPGHSDNPPQAAGHASGDRPGREEGVVRTPQGSVLIVDDHESNRALVRAILEGQGLEVIEAGGALAAIEVARRAQPSIILMDLAMPGVDGFEATRRLKADPATARIPIVALTALATREAEEAALEAGATGYLCKPVDGGELVRLVSSSRR